MGNATIDTMISAPNTFYNMLTFEILDVDTKRSLQSNLLPFGIIFPVISKVVSLPRPV
jgi:hypothetical protein